MKKQTSENSNRVDGIYWVKFEGEWLAAKYNQKENIFEVPGDDCYWYDKDFEEIDETRIVRK